MKTFITSIILLLYIHFNGISQSILNRDFEEHKTIKASQVPIYYKVDSSKKVIYLKTPGNEKYTFSTDKITAYDNGVTTKWKVKDWSNFKDTSKVQVQPCKGCLIILQKTQIILPRVIFKDSEVLGEIQPIPQSSINPPMGITVRNTFYNPTHADSIKVQLLMKETIKLNKKLQPPYKEDELRAKCKGNLREQMTCLNDLLNFLTYKIEEQ